MRKDHDFKRECTAMVCKCSRYGICSKEFQIAGQNSEAAKITNYGYSSCSAQQWSWEVVGRRQCAQGDAGSSWGSSASLIVDLTFHGQWHHSQVLCQPACTAPFVLENILVLQKKSHQCHFPSCNGKVRKLFQQAVWFGPFWPRTLHPRHCDTFWQRARYSLCGEK